VAEVAEEFFGSGGVVTSSVSGLDCLFLVHFGLLSLTYVMVHRFGFEGKMGASMIKPWGVPCFSFRRDYTI
jgi:hypothetical protein